MTPQEKADELYVGYWRLTNNAKIAKECALMAADEVLKETSNKHFIIGRNGRSGTEYWQEVKQEIEKL
jgi:hypothetical protein